MNAAVQMTLLQAEVEQATCEVCALAEQIQDLDRVISARERLGEIVPADPAARRSRHHRHQRYRHAYRIEEE